MHNKDLKRVLFLLMFAMLTITAPKWLNPANQEQSNYDAPWIYPGLEPRSR